MKSVLVIGLSPFGRHIAEKMQEMDNEVFVVDKNDSLVAEYANRFTSAQIGDCTSEGVIRSLGVSNFDICFVTMGEDFETSLVITSLLKENGAPCIVARAKKKIQAELLTKIGAHEVVCPERESAVSLAVRYSSDRIFDYVELTPEFAIYEISVPAEWTGKSIAKLDIRNRYHINIIALKRDGVLNPSMSADTVFEQEDHIVVIGKSGDVLPLSVK